MATTSTLPPATTTTTSSPPTTTTQSPDARLAEIQALAKETFVGRMKAMYDKDEGVLLQWIASQSIYDDTVQAILEDRVKFLVEPSEGNIQFTVDDLLLDRSDCVVVQASAEAEGVVEGVSEPSTFLWVFWPQGGILQIGAVWQIGTPEVQWIEECDIAQRGVTP